MAGLFKRFGQSLESVEPDFDARAITEISFRRTSRRSIAPEDLDRDFVRCETHELAPEAEGSVQSETQQELLDGLGRRVAEVLGDLGPDDLLVVDNGPGPDHPKTRQRIANVTVRGENRLRFHYLVRPPLRLVEYRRKGEAR